MLKSGGRKNNSEAAEEGKGHKVVIEAPLGENKGKELTDMVIPEAGGKAASTGGKRKWVEGLLLSEGETQAKSQAPPKKKAKVQKGVAKGKEVASAETAEVVLGPIEGSGESLDSKRAQSPKELESALEPPKKKKKGVQMRDAVDAARPGVESARKHEASTLLGVKSGEVTRCTISN